MSLLVKNVLDECDVILASASPRRKELFSYLCDNFRVIPSKYKEVIPPEVKPEDAAVFLSEMKCKSLSEVYRSSFVVGCDTVVILDGMILGKPHDEKDAERILNLLSGKEHQVITGVTLCYKKLYRSFKCVTKVKFRELSHNEIMYYIASGEPMDKAGAYGIQGLGAMLAERIEGDFFNIVGLPLTMLSEEIEKFLSE